MLAGLAWTQKGESESLSLKFSDGALGLTEILDSATSPPARYLVEIGRRLLLIKPQASMLAIANPLLPITKNQMTQWLQEKKFNPQVIADQKGFPLLYILPRQAFEEFERYLLLLSMVDDALDINLLTVLLKTEIGRYRISNFEIGPYPRSTQSGWFQGVDRQRILKFLALHATKLIQENPSWHSLPLTVYHPYHAGSIVFFMDAARNTKNLLFNNHIICSSFRDFVSHIDYPLTPLWLKLPWLPRDNSIGEPQYFHAAIERLGQEIMQENFIVFMRYSRSTGRGPFHLIDQNRFSLGDSVIEPYQTLSEQTPPFLKKSSIPVNPLRVLCHFTGGIAIKNYPLDYCKSTIRILTSLDIDVTVINRPDLVSYGAQSIEAEETDLLYQAVENHHIFIGLDSFPHHFVRNIMGWPTIGLFGATKATNFGGGWHKHYRSSDSALPCHPCHSEKNCPINGSSECSNYSHPQKLISLILDMAKDVYDFTPSH